ncbi:MAG TPA: ABC transporter substrate-binding protein [Acidimicrobiales bacterium]|nr:ABC transporter substrate-binding protein [Acidimicrobiales bacterium]
MLVGVLYDFPQGDDGALFEGSLRIGIDEVAATGRLDRSVELLPRHARGLPAGTAHEIEQAFGELEAAGALVIVGPSISDNGLIVGPLADESGVPCINYTGGERTRSRYMFHYQVGSLTEEPAVLARYLSHLGLASAAVAYDHSPVGRGYHESFTQACATAGVEITASAAVSPLAEDLSATVRRLRAAGPDALVYLGLGVAARPLALAVARESWKVQVVANSALMFGYARRDWRADWEGWVYVDTVSDENSVRAQLAGRSARSAGGPIGVAAYDMGRLVAEALARADHLTRDGVRDALERVKMIPSASGLEGTTMGFGHWDHGALKGSYLVLRRWEGGKTVQVEH